MPEMNADRTPVDLLVRNGYVITVDTERRILTDGAVAVSGRRIVDVGTTESLLSRYRATNVFDAAGGIVHPGFVEPHIHISQYHSRSATSVFQMPEPPFPAAAWKANLLPEDEYPSTALGCLELLRAGFTSFVEPGTAFSPDATAEAAERVGIRGWVTDTYLWDFGETLKLFPALISDELMRRVPCDHERCLRELGSQLHRNRNADSLIKGHVAVYGEATASDALRQAAKACARDNGVTYTEHLGFSPAIDQAERERLGRSQVEHAAALGILDEATTAVHMSFLDDADLDIVAGSGMSVVWCAANYLVVAAGSGARTRLPALYRRGTDVGLGLDTPAGTNPGDNAMIANLAAREAGDYVRPAELLEMQTIAAAGTIGAKANIGSLEAGKKADIVIRRADEPAADGFDPIYELMLYQRARDVDTVIVDGQIVMRDGRSTRVDENVIREESRRSMRSIVDRIGMTSTHGWPVTE